MAKSTEYEARSIGTGFYPASYVSYLTSISIRDEYSNPFQDYFNLN
jgi:hypothetical protein